MKVPGLRPSREQIGGLFFFGRMLDKIRLKAAGKLPPDYYTGTVDRTHFDARCCTLLQIDYDKVVARVLQGGTDEEILEWCFANGYRPRTDEIEVWNGFLSKRGWRDAGSSELVAAKNAAGFAGRDDIQTWFDLQEAEEA